MCNGVGVFKYGVVGGEFECEGEEGGGDVCGEVGGGGQRWVL